MMLMQLMQLQLWLYLRLYGCRGQWLPIGDCRGLRLLVTYLCDDLLLLLRLLLVLDAHLVLLRLRLISKRLTMLLWLLLLMLYAWPGRGLHLLLLLVVVALVLVVVLWEIALRVAQRYIRFALMLLQIDWLVQIVIDNVVLGGLLADVVVRWGHANQMDLMKGEALGAYPRMLLTLLAVMEHLAAQRLIRIVAVGKH